MKTKRCLLSIISLFTLIATFSGCSTLSLIKKAKDNAATHPADEITKYAENEYEFESEYKFEDRTYEKITLSNESFHAQNYITSKEAFIAKIKTLIDTSLYEENDYESTYSYTMDFSLQRETEYDFDYIVKLDDGTQFTFPTPVKELKRQGWTSDQNPEVEADSLLAGPSLINSQGKEIYWVSVKNDSEGTLNFDECEIVGCSFRQYSSFDHKEKYDNAIGFTVCDSITEDSTLEDIVKRLGNPSEISCNVYEYNGEYQNTTITLTYKQLALSKNSMRFVLSGDGNYIIKMEYSKQI